MSAERLRAHAEVLREALEALLLRLDVRGGNPGAASGLRETVRALSAFVEISLDDPRSLAEIEQARAALGKVRASMEPAAEDDAALLSEAEEWIATIRLELGNRRVASAPLATAHALPPFSASKGSPALFVGVDVPAPELIPVDDRWAAYEEGAPKSDKSSAPVPAGLAYTQIQAMGRDLMEDLAILGGLRESLDEQPWAESGRFEERLLHNLDALLSLEQPIRKEVPRLELVRQLHRYATEWQVADHGRSFTLAFTLACLQSETALRWVVLAAQRAPERALPAFASALCLGSSPYVSSAIKALIATDSAPLMELGLLVARRRRHFDASFLSLITHPDVAVAEAAVRAFSFAPRATATEALIHVLDKGGHLAAVAAEVLATTGHPRAVPAARELLHPVPAAPTARLALRILALNADRKDSDLVHELALAVPGALPLLGFFGAPEHARVIVEQLRNLENVDDAERALMRLTGIAFLPPYDVDKLHEQVDARVREWTGRIRFGKPYNGVRDTLAELIAPLTLQRDRRVLSIEAGMLAKEPMRVDLDGWVKQQRADLDSLSSML